MHFKIIEMAGRPEETGLDYYQLDTDVFDDRKVRRLITTHGHTGFTIWIFLMTEIYRKQGYYLQVDADSVFDFSDELKCPEDQVHGVIDYCTQIGLFDADMYTSHGILTSTKIQERWTEISKRSKRKICEPETRFNLLDGKLNSFHILKEQIEFTPEEIELTPEEIPQSKAKESKVKEKQSESEGAPARKVLFKDSIYFEKEKFLSARPADCGGWEKVPHKAKEILYSEILSWATNNLAFRYQDGWILEAFKWYSRNPSKYQDKNHAVNGHNKFPQTESQRISTMVNHGAYLTSNNDKWAKIPGTMWTGNLSLNDNGHIVLIKSGVYQLIIKPEDGYKSNREYALKEGNTIQNVHQYLLNEKMKKQNAPVNTGSV